MSSRSLALAALRRWRASTDFADHIIGESLGQSALGAADRGFTLELFYGVLRNLSLLDFWIAQLRPESVDPGSRDILRLGLYQLLLLETAEHAAVFETVELAAKRARPLINAILRRAAREKIRLTNAVVAQPLAIQFSQPEFLIAKWTSQFGPDVTAELCRWNNQPAAVFARVNSLKISPAEFLQKYPASESLADRVEFVRLKKASGALAAGDCYIQDPSTVTACKLLDPQPNELVLDACAPPGGKSAYLAALMGNAGRLTAVDRDPARLERLRENLARLGVINAEIVHRDWTNEKGLFPEASFDKILVDAPCSNTGVMRRRVDVRWRLREEDFRRMPPQQLAILRRVAPLLKAGGSLVYSTCSLEAEENEEVVRQFLRAHPDFRLTKTETSLPWRDGFDGAFAARLKSLA